jgi:hypothetical protein
MVPVLLIVYVIPLYNIGIFWIHLGEFVRRDDQGQITLIYYNEINNVTFTCNYKMHLSNFYFAKGTTLNTYIGIATLWTVLFLALCIPINLAILWAYRKRRNQQQTREQNQGIIGQHLFVGNAAAKVKADMIERRLLLFAVITFFGHALISIFMVGKLLY